MARKKEEKKLSGREMKRLACGGRSSGQPRTFQSEDELLKLYEEFILFVQSSDYTVAPTRNMFKWWLEHYKKIKCDFKTIYLSINQYYPEMKKYQQELIADTIVEGCLKGQYQPTMSIFTLKNVAGWTDKQETALSNKDDKAFRIELDAQLSDWAK